MDAERKRKAHKKSRRGCRNCKLRRVKCDETRPMCMKCADYGVSCNYGDSKAPDLQMSFQGFVAPVLDLVKIPKALVAPPPIVMDNFQPSSFQLDRQMLDRLGRFKMRTVFSMGNHDMAKLYEEESIELAFRAPYLMHIVQTITALHDRYLSGAPISRTSVADICYHWSQGISLFNRKLSSPIQDVDRDPLWSAAALSGIIAFASIEATRPEDAWPLKPPESSDLDWLRMAEGKTAVFRLTNPLRPESIFHPLLKKYHIDKKQWVDASSLSDRELANIPGAGAGLGGALIGPGIEQLPLPFIKLYDLDLPTGRNPYYGALYTLGQLLSLECSQKTLIKFLGFQSHLTVEFKSLLEAKDHRALLLLAYWFAKVCGTSVWWMDRRATLECQAICLYLERNSRDVVIHDLLEFPRIKCGIGPFACWGSPKGSPANRMTGLLSSFNIIESH